MITYMIYEKTPIVQVRFSYPWFDSSILTVFLLDNTFFEKGLDFFMRTVDSVEYIQNKVKRGSKLPFVLTIRLTNLTNNTQGNLQIVDLLRPPFTLPSTKGNRHLYRSFSHLCKSLFISL
jgi:hypothetical protein